MPPLSATRVTFSNLISSMYSSSCNSNVIIGVIFSGTNVVNLSGEYFHTHGEYFLKSEKRCEDVTSLSVSVL